MENLNIVLIVGKRNVGKTSIRTQICLGYFSEEYSPSVSLSISSYDTSAGRILFFDSCENSDLVLQHNYKAVILTFDMSSLESFKVLSALHEQLSGSSSLFFIVGNKLDLAAEVSMDEIRALAHDLHCRFFLISLKTGDGFQDFWEVFLNKISS